MIFQKKGHAHIKQLLYYKENERNEDSPRSPHFAHYSARLFIQSIYIHDDAINRLRNSLRVPARSDLDMEARACNKAITRARGNNTQS